MSSIRTSFNWDINQLKRASLYTLWSIMKIFYMTLCCEIRKMISNTIKRALRSIYLQEQLKNVRKALLMLLSWRFIFHQQKKWFIFFASELHAICIIFNSRVSSTIFSLIFISSEFFWLLMLTYVISYESMHLTYLKNWKS